MLRGIVLGLSLTLAAALQLVDAPGASADGGLLDDLTSILPLDQDTSDATPADGESTALLDGLLDTVDQVADPATGGLLNPLTDALDTVTEELGSQPLGEAVAGALDETAEPLTAVFQPATHPGLPTAASANGAATSASPADAPLALAASLLEVMNPVALATADTIAIGTEPLQPLAADVAPLLATQTESSGLVPLTPALETLQPAIRALQPILVPSLQLTSAVVGPLMLLIEPAVAPVLRTLDRALQPVVGLLQPIIGPVVDVPLPLVPEISLELVPGTGEPTLPGAASTTGGSSFVEGDMPVQAPALARTAVLMALASLQVLEIPGTQSSKPNLTLTAPLRILQGVMLNAAEASQPARQAAGPSVLLLGGAGAGEKESSPKFQAPFAALPQFIVLMVVLYFMFMLTYGARSQSWLKCPVRPPI